jgi:hypothetical protein
MRAIYCAASATAASERRGDRRSKVLEAFMRPPRRAWIIATVTAAGLFAGAATLSHVPQRAAGQTQPHGTLPGNQIPVQVRPFHGAPTVLTPEPQRHGHAAPGEQGEDHGQGHGNSNGHDSGSPQATPESGGGQ